MHFGIEGSVTENTSGVSEPARAPTNGDTIAAISTPVGEGAISIVRLSGASAVEIADGLFHGREKPSTFAPHMQHYGAIREISKFVDQVMLSVHRAPASYTGEDLVEISCHGGTLVTARVLEVCLRAGARQAGPGEFTERSFLNGKMDLTQAEAVIDLIRAKTDLALRSATEQLEGRLGKRIREIRDELVSILAHLEAAIDFPDEGINPDDVGQMRHRIANVGRQISELIDTANQGRVLREGVRVVIYGATNAGKSSLLNRLLGHERVIVSESHGTTRDTIEETLNLRGYPVRLIDTAGLRDVSDHIEKEGIARTRKTLQQADVRLHVVDHNQPRQADFDLEIEPGIELLVLNKNDLSEHSDWTNAKGVRVSCLTGEGVSDLEQEIVRQITGGHVEAESAIAINARHRECLRRAREAVERISAGLKQQSSPEYIAVDVKDALQAVGQIIGTVDVEQVLDSVFSQFCIGK